MDWLELEKLFALAIAREAEAREFYYSAAQKVENASVKAIFAELAEQEIGHGEMLEQFKADPSLTMKMQAPKADWKIAETTELPALNIAIAPKDALALAMKKEEQAVNFYRSLAVAASDAEMRNIFENFANMELNHKQRLETLFVDIGFPEVF